MPIYFPDNPTQGQTYTANGRTWTYDGKGWAPGTAIGATGATGAAGINGATGATGPAGSNASANATTVSDQINTSTGYFDLPSGTTAQRPESPPTGAIRYNTTTGFAEVYTSAGWGSFGAQPPSISTVTPATYNGEAGTIFTINGANFTSDAVVKFVDNNNIEYTAAVTTFVNSGTLTASTPQDFTVAQEPLDIKVIQISGQVVKLDCIDCGSAPTWVTAAGLIATINHSGENYSNIATVVATDPDNAATISYSVTSGSLPPGTSLNSSTGVISGDPTDVASATTSTFSITATDNAGNQSTRQFSIIVRPPPIATDYIVVAGGGSGGKSGGGGGGAGGVRTGTGYSIFLGTSYTVTIGAGGAVGTGSASPSAAGTGLSGSNSVFDVITSAGGGGGGNGDWDPSGGASGGSGGGNGRAGGSLAAAASGNTPAVTPVQGYAGGQNSTSSPYPAGGGGGAGAVGSTGSGANSGAGGVGIVSSIIGGQVYYGGGGGGGGSSANGTQNVGFGGDGGGGHGGGLGGDTQTGPSGSPGIANTGGGGGGGFGNPSATHGGGGGSGVVIISYPNTYIVSATNGLTFTSASGASGIRYTRFTAGTGTFTYTAVSGLYVEYLIVGGGSSGYAGHSHGGAAGQVIIDTATLSTSVPYSITIGAGGSTATTAGTYNAGNASSFNSLTAAAGNGRTGPPPENAASGSFANGSGGLNTYPVSGNTLELRRGGPGTQSTITGTNLYYGGGGGAAGGHSYEASQGGRGGFGGGGGGGTGPGGPGGPPGLQNGTYGPAGNNYGAAGLANTGGGGGGGGVGSPTYQPSGSGGSGIVILKIPNTYTATFSGGLTASAASTAVAGFKIYTVTAGTGTVTYS